MTHELDKVEMALRDVLADGEPRDEAQVRLLLRLRLWRVPALDPVITRSRALHRLPDGRIVALPGLVDGLQLCVTPGEQGQLHVRELALVRRRYSGWTQIPVTIRRAGEPDVRCSVLRQRAAWTLPLLRGPEMASVRTWTAVAGPEGLTLTPGLPDPMTQQAVDRAARQVRDPAPGTRSPLPVHLLLAADLRQMLLRHPASLGRARRMAAATQTAEAAPASRGATAGGEVAA